MTPDQFRQWSDLLPAPMLLLSGEGTVLAANGSAASRFGLRCVEGQRLDTLPGNPPGEIARYLRACSRTRKRIPGSLRLAGSDGEPAEVRCEGALLVPHADAGQRRILLRILPKHSAVAQFLALNQKLEELTAEMIHRRQTENELHRHKQRLEKSEERLRLALEAGKMGTWDWDIDTGEVVWSSGLEAIHGLKPGEFSGAFEAYQNDLHPDDRQRVLEAIRRTLETGGEHHIEYRVVWPDGSVHWVEARGRLFHGDDRRPRRMIGLCMDIDLRKQLEEQLCDRLEELAEGEERIRSVVDHVVDGIITIDEQGIIQSVNPAAEKAFGYAAAELVGRNVRILMPEPDRSRHQGYIKNYLRTGEVKIIGIGREVRGRCKDGTTFPMELGVSEFRFRGQRFFTGIVRDIPERKRAENVARFIAHASRSLATLVDYESTMRKVAGTAVPFFADWCAVHMVDEQGVLRQLAVAHVEPSKVEMVETLGRRYPPDPEAVARAARAFRTGKPELVAEIPDALLVQSARDEEHLEILRRLGLKSYICVPLAAREKPLGVITFVTAESGRQYDANDLKVAEDLAYRAATAIENARLYRELRDADRRKDEFLAMLAHELRNPLAPIRSGLDLMATCGVQPAAVELMQEQVEHLVRLVDDLLDVSRIMQGKVELRRQATPLVPIAERAVLSVQDTGIGMSKELLPRIFDLFTQADRSLERSQSGLGIGLTLVRSLVEMHGGSVEAFSEGEGRGSRFAVNLPARTETFVREPRPAHEAPACPRRILVVDDNVGAAKMLAMLLSAVADHEVQIVHDGFSALETAKLFQPEIVLLDIGLPRMNGYEVAKRLRQQPGVEGTVLVALTGYGTEDDRRRSLAAGFDEHLVKPPSMDSLRRLAAHPRLFELDCQQS